MSKNNLFYVLPVVIIGYIFIACNNGGGDNGLVNNDQNQYVSYELKGTLIITDLDYFNDKYISGSTHFIQYDKDGNGKEIYTSHKGLKLVAYDDFGSGIVTRRGLISNGSVTLEVWDWDSDNKFSGNGKIVFYATIVNDATGASTIISWKNMEITFVNWSGTGSWGN
jgi:hypothetical protein